MKIKYVSLHIFVLLYALLGKAEEENPLPITAFINEVNYHTANNHEFVTYVSWRKGQSFSLCPGAGFRIHNFGGQLSWSSRPDGSLMAQALTAGSALVAFFSGDKSGCVRSVLDKTEYPAGFRIKKDSSLELDLQKNDSVNMPLVLELFPRQSTQEEGMITPYGGGGLDDTPQGGKKFKPYHASMLGDEFSFGVGGLSAFLAYSLVMIDGRSVKLPEGDVAWLQMHLYDESFHEQLLHRLVLTCWLGCSDQNLRRSQRYLAMSQARLWLLKLGSALQKELGDLREETVTTSSALRMSLELEQQRLSQVSSGHVVPGLASLPLTVETTKVSPENPEYNGQEQPEGANAPETGGQQSPRKDSKVNDPRNDDRQVAEKTSESSGSPTLIIMAAGRGSRYGGAQQTEILPYIEKTLAEVTIRDALKAGIKKIVLVIRKELEGEIQKNIVSRLPEGTDVTLAYQDMNDLPGGFQVSDFPGREKPWGTAHAIWSAREHIHGSFIVLNADDHYGMNPFSQLMENMHRTRDWSMLAYRLENTLSDNPNGVSRSLCTVSDDCSLLSIAEHYDLKQCGTEICGHEKNKKSQTVPGSQLVSMNIWGFQVNIFEHLEAQFKIFLEQLKQAKAEEMNQAELLVADIVQQAIVEGIARVRVLESNEQWHGMTYQEEKYSVGKAMAEMYEDTSASALPAQPLTQNPEVVESPQVMQQYLEMMANHPDLLRENLQSVQNMNALKQVSEDMQTPEFRERVQQLQQPQNIQLTLEVMQNPVYWQEVCKMLENESLFPAIFGLMNSPGFRGFSQQLAQQPEIEQIPQQLHHHNFMEMQRTAEIFFQRLNNEMDEGLGETLDEVMGLEGNDQEGNDQEGVNEEGERELELEPDLELD